MDPTVAPWLYWLRLRKWPISEALAGIGIATGVALFFAVLVANSSVTGSVEQLVHGITGSSKYALVARDQQGFPEGFAQVVQANRDVRAAAPLVVERASVGGPAGSSTVELVGVTVDFANLSGKLVRSFGGLYGVRLANSLLLPEPIARRLGVGPSDPVQLHLFGRAITARVAAVVGKQQIGALADSPVVVGPLRFVQSLSGLRGRVTHVLVAPRPGRDAAVKTALTRIAADRLDVVPSENEARLVKQAAAPNEQSTGMFAAISMVVGILFAFNAMLLTAPERRRIIAELRMQGFSRIQLTTVLLFEALFLGAVASGIGLLLGDQLSRHFFHAVPGYLSFAFPVGHARIVSFGDLASAFAAGMGATLLATARPLADVFTKKALDTAYRTSEEPSAGVPGRTQRRLLAAALGLVAFAAAVLVLRPAATNLGIVALGLAMLAVLPSLLTAALAFADRASLGPTGGGLVSVAGSELSASMTRAIALAATGALAVFGSLSIEGAHRDLLRGLDSNQASYVGTADVWVSAGGDENSLTTTPFAMPGTLKALVTTRRVAAVRPYRGGFLDVAGRRLWLVARDPAERAPIPAEQMVSGNLTNATRLLRAGGVVVVSDGLADALGVRVGELLHLPTPTGTTTLRLVATTTNLGWSPGTVLLNGRDYARLWGTNNVTGVEIDLNPGTSPAAGRQIVASALGLRSALTVETADERLARLKRLSRQGLDRLSQISTLMLAAAALVMAAAIVAAVWQQRRRLAVLRMQGFGTGQVWRVLLIQSALVLSVGAALGAVFGLGGQVLATRWTSLTTGFPAIFSPAIGLAGFTFAGVALLALLFVSLPGYWAARVSPAMSFHND
jgi:putative ABC transport system permease protein